MRNIIELKSYDQNWYSRGRSNIVILLWWFIQGTIFRFSIHNMYKWRNFLLRIFGAKIGIGVKVRPTCKITYPWKVSIGDYTWIGDDVKLYSLDNITIGKNCVISQESYLCTGSHNIRDKRFSLITRPINISDGAWIASDVFIYPGITIEEMAVVAARSTVTMDIPSNKVYGGNPAKFLKIRFKEHI
jgi:putative colanic acid biosynthesis acetyltransferase WcaF